ncbi:MAG: hypothetical protein K6G34_06825 [Lachnospiraceae bacterium]|nr:hypothetical protein [Lachnospiraceae bacterium]
MRSKLISLKKALFGSMAFVMAATLVSPASAALAAEVETQTEAEEAAADTGKSTADTADTADTAAGAQKADESDTAVREMNLKVTNRTTGRSGATIVKDPVVSDIEAPEAGKRLDDKALVTTAEKEQWEVPVLWVSSYGQVISGTASDNQTLSNTAVLGQKYLPVIAYVVPENYTIADTDGSAGTYMLKFTKEVTKLFGDSPVITIYDNNTGITYLLPASLKNLFAAKSKDSSPDDSYCTDENDCNCNPNAVSDAYDEGDGEWEFGGGDDVIDDDTPAETELQKLVRIHCNDAAKKVFSQGDLEFFADLIINKLQPQAVNLLLASFPSFRQEAENGRIGKNVGLEIDYDPDATYYGYATKDPDIKDGTLSYFVSINTAMLVKDKKAANPVVTKEGENIIELANTMVHEFFHVFMYDFNRTGMTGMTTPTEPTTVNGKETEKYLQARFPQWFIEGTASSVEHNWRGRHDEFIVLRREFSENTQYRQLYERDLLLKRYVLGFDKKQDDGSIKNYFTYDLECANGFDKYGNAVDTVGSRYTAGYLATLYLSELSARSHPQIGSSVRQTESGDIAFNNVALKYGLDYILARIHNGESLDSVIKDISGGRYQSTNDFEAKFIKGPLTEGYYFGDDDSISFSLDFMNYMLSISRTEGRDNVANGSILFDFEQDFGIPLDPNKNDTTNILAVYPYMHYVSSSVDPEFAHTSGGKSVDGTPMSSSNVVPFPGSDSQAGAGDAAAKEFAAEEVAAEEVEGVPAPDDAAAVEEAQGVPAPGDAAAVEDADDGDLVDVDADTEEDSSLDAEATTEGAIVEDDLNSEEAETAAVDADAAEEADLAESAATEEASASAEAEEEVVADGTSSAEVEESSEEISEETDSADAITEN